MTLGLLYHMAAVVAGAMGVPPSSELERHMPTCSLPIMTCWTRATLIGIMPSPADARDHGGARLGDERPDGSSGCRSEILPVP